MTVTVLERRSSELAFGKCLDIFLDLDLAYLSPIPGRLSP